MPAPQPLAQVHAVGVRQKDIHQDDIEVLAGMAQRLAAGLRTDHFIILLAVQKVTGRVPDHGIVLHQKHTDHSCLLSPLFRKTLLY